MKQAKHPTTFFQRLSAKLKESLNLNCPNVGSAVKQIIDRGCLINDVSERIGNSAQRLYKWVKAASPTKENELEREVAGSRFLLAVNQLFVFSIGL